MDPYYPSTTKMLGEEEPVTTNYLGEEEFTTKMLGEETETTYRIGEEGGGIDPIDRPYEAAFGEF